MDSEDVTDILTLLCLLSILLSTTFFVFFVTTGLYVGVRGEISGTVMTVKYDTFSYPTSEVVFKTGGGEGVLIVFEGHVPFEIGKTYHVWTVRVRNGLGIPARIERWEALSS